MRSFRHLAVQRFLSAGLLLSLVAWLAAPVTGASAQQTFAAEAEWLDTAPATVEAAFEQALTEAAAQGARTPEAFVAAFADVLAAQADPELARFLQTHPPDALQTVLYGQWMRAFSHHRGLEAAPGPPVAAPAGTALGACARWEQTDEGVRAYAATPRPSIAERALCPLDELSSAQPLGP
jgi:hypothetical protein